MLVAEFLLTRFSEIRLHSCKVETFVNSTYTHHDGTNSPS